MRKSKGFNRPMGEILHIVDGEAITHPLSAFRSPRTKVILENSEEIGILREPFGPTSRPFQAIKLHNPNNKEIVGKSVYAALVSKRKGNRKRHYRGKK
ncbi:MAG: hypothetical protein GPJ54_21555 [Candidatus Heimdallarchaeota archaeon]|nr:hypothetical protein [Candidatus Heimdallarchaeota archaeon]